MKKAMEAAEEKKRLAEEEATASKLAEEKAAIEKVRQSLDLGGCEPWPWRGP